MTVKQTVEITNKLGMHARPAMKLFELMQNLMPKCCCATMKARKRKPTA
jgi:phosphocarrier protein NPr